jgi:hypothetical protein
MGHPVLKDMNMRMSLHSLWAGLKRLCGKGGFDARLALCVLALGWSLPASAQSAVPTLDRLKVAYVYNFAKFVELPGTEELPIRLCVVGKDDPHDRMLSLNRRIAQKREIQVRRDAPLGQLKDCGIVFVGATESRQLPTVVRQLGNAPVLLISDDRLAVDQGAHLVLLHNDDRVEFEVNLLNLQKSNLRASSQMLKLARTVIR